MRLFTASWLSALLAALAGLLLAACGVPLPEEASSPTPTPSGDIREQVVAALEQPGTVIQVHVTIVQEGTGAESVIRSWIDLPNNRARYEQVQHGEPHVIKVIADSMEASYIRSMNRFDESQFVLPEEMIGHLPRSLHNPALRGMWPLALSLWRSEWRPYGTGEWEGRPATLWEADFPGPEGSMHTYTTIFLDAETNLPLGQVTRSSQRQGEPPEFEYRVTYEITFLSTDQVPPNTFDRQALHGLTERFGGLLDRARGANYTVLWLGPMARLGEGYPEVSLANVAVNEIGDPWGLLVAFRYHGPSGPGGHRSELSILARPHSDWERTVEQHPDSAWWASVQRQPVIIDGVQGEYVIGERHRPTPEHPAAIEMVIWLPDSVVRVFASPVLVPVNMLDPTPPPSHPGQRATAATPDLENMADINAVNTEEAMRSVLKALHAIE